MRLLQVKHLTNRISFLRFRKFMLRCSKLNLGRNCGFVSILKRTLQTSPRKAFSKLGIHRVGYFHCFRIARIFLRETFLRGQLQQSSYWTTKSIVRLDLRSARLNAWSCLFRDCWSVSDVRYGPFTNWFRFRATLPPFDFEERTQLEK